MVNDQVESVCQMLAADPKLKGGFNAIGFSQVRISYLSLLLNNLIIGRSILARLCSTMQ